MDPGYMVLVAPLMKPKVCDLRPHPQEERTRECHLCLHLMEGCHWHRKPEQSLTASAKLAASGSSTARGMFSGQPVLKAVPLSLITRLEEF